MMPYLSLSLFGGFEVTLDGEPIRGFATDKSRALLAFLAVESARPHRRAELAGMFWPDLPDKKAAHNLSQTLLRLRAALREPNVAPPTGRRPFLLITRLDVQFNPHSDYRLDVASFGELLRVAQQHHHPDARSCAACARWLQQAAELYRGDLLAGFFLTGSIGFEEWLLIQREMLHRQAVEILARLAGYHEERGDNELVQHYARQLVALEPWHEQGHLRLVRALARGGQTAAALDRYAAYCRVLAEEFNLGPSAEAVTLFQQIQSGQVGAGVTSGPPPEQAPGGRRQVTVLACSQRDPAGSSDPDELNERLARCGPACQAILARYGGHRQPRSGNGCLVYFGYPQALEDAARRAVHAGLAIVAANSGGTARAGIHTGVVLVSADHGLIGDVPDVARGCLGLAATGTVVISEDTERLVRGWFRCRELGPRTLPGLAGRLEVHHVLGESGVHSRLEWLAQTRGLTTFIGREVELHRLLALGGCAGAGDGIGQVVLIGGQAGIGKSRLLWELKARLALEHGDQARTWLESRCSPYFQNTGLYPIVGLLEQLLGFEAGDGPQAKRDKLDAELARHGVAHPAATWLLSLLLGLPTDTRVPQTITVDQRERMCEMFVVLLQKQAARRPLVVVIEDLHWSDPTTVEWLGRSFDALAAAPCLMLLTHRPTFVPPWSPRPHLVPLGLEPLTATEARSMVADIAGDGALPEEVRGRIVRQTDGIPLFVEELTRAALDLHSGGNAPPGALQIPATLRDSLLARIDRAGTAKETAQWAAVVGREFAYPILRAVVPFDERRLQDDLAVLVEHDLVHAQPHAARPAFSFRHTLIQETAYDTLPRQIRQGYHRHIAETLETSFPQVAETQPEVVAHHYAGAGAQARAVELWTRAGERATAQGATLEAITLFDRALAAIEPGDAERHWQALWGRETALFFRGERPAQLADIEALLELAETVNDDTRRAQARLRRARYAASQADYPGQLAAAEAAIAAAGRAGAVSLEVEALAYQVTALLRLDGRPEVHAAVKQTLAKTESVEDDGVRAYARAAVAVYCIDQGDLGRAAQLLIQSLEAARRAEVRALDAESQYLGHLGVVYAQLGLYPQAREALEAGLELANLLGIGRYQAYHLFNLGFVCSELGELDAAMRMEEQALARFEASGNVFGQASCQMCLGTIYEQTGDLARAADCLQAACAAYAEIGVDAHRFEAQATAARVARRRGQPDQARRLALEVWGFMRQNETEELGLASDMYLCLADVFEAAGAPGVSAREVIEAGYRRLMSAAGKISDPEWRRALLENVAAHRELIARRAEYQSATPSPPDHLA